MFFHVMYFNHGKEIVTIDQLEFIELSPNPTRHQVFPLLIPNVSIDTTLPRVRYVASYPLHSIATKENIICSCLPYQDPITTIDYVTHLIQIVDPALNSIYPTNILDMSPTWYGLLPSNEVFQESLI